MGKDAIKRKIQELKIDEIPVDVALGARDLIRDFTLDQVRMVSAGGATFYVWVSFIAVTYIQWRTFETCYCCGEGGEL